MKRKGVLLAAFILVLVAVSFTAYVAKYQQLMNEALKLSDQHCIVINPLIIQRKEAYIDSMRALKGTVNKNAYMSAQDSYLALSKEYLGLEKNWLDLQNDFLKRRDVQLLLEEDVRELMLWEYTMNRAEYEGTEAVVKLFTERNEVKQQDLTDTILRSTRETALAKQRYNLVFTNAKREENLRDLFIRIPDAECPEENYNIPDVNAELETL